MSHKGYKQTEEHKMKVKLSRNSEQRSKDAIKSDTGKWMKGRVAWNKGLKGFRAGEKRPGIIPKGELNSGYKKDRTKLQRYGDANKDRRSSSYNNWRKEVLIRDGYKCKIINKDCHGRLEVHHILGYTDHPELRYDINNGITLCHFHHPRVRKEEKRLVPSFMELVSVSNILL